MLENVADDDYRGSTKDKSTKVDHVSHTQVGRMIDKTGALLHAQLHGPDATWKSTHNPSPLLVLEADGSRYRTNEADKHVQKKKPGRVQARKTDADDESELSREERDRGWRENKIGIIYRALHGKTVDGEYQPPQELLKTYVATTGKLSDFERDLYVEAIRRGIHQAANVVCVSDNGHGLPSMWVRLFELLRLELNRVTDFYHCSERLNACSKILTVPKESNRYWQRLRGLLWRGKAEKVLETLRQDAPGLAPRPARLADLDDLPNAKTVWSHIFYFERYKDTMNYPEYREKGWPMGSGSVESACGQFGERVKHNRMRWTRKTADALHGIKAAILSQDQRWENLWPPPVSVLAVPSSFLYN